MSAFERVLAAPASLEARRALLAEWAQAGDPRAELLDLGLRQWRFLREPPTPEYADLMARSAELIRRHGAAWAGPIAGRVERFRFHRGLVAEITMPLDRFVDEADELLALAPIQHVNLRAPATRFLDFIAHARFGQIVSFEVAGVRAIGDAEASALATSRHASQLRWIALSRNGIGRAGVEALAASAALAQVRFLALDGNPFDPSPAVFSDGGVVTVQPSPYALELERAHGPRPWLIPSNELAASWPPSRDMLAAA